MAGSSNISRSLFIPLLLSAGIFMLLFCLAQPAYFSWEDVYVAYQLAGGFGHPPSNLVHYNYLMNPVLGWPLKWLFNNIGNVNWYSLSVYASYLCSLFIMSYALLTGSQKPGFIVLYVVTCVVFGGWAF